VQNLINRVQEALPLTATQPKARGILVIGGIKGAGTTTGVCPAQPLTRNPFRGWKAHRGGLRRR